MMSSIDYTYLWLGTLESLYGQGGSEGDLIYPLPHTFFVIMPSDMFLDSSHTSFLESAEKRI